MSDSENNIRERIRELKDFYTSLVIYGAVIFACFVIWATTGGPFWPIWVIVALGSVATLNGIRLGLFPKLSELLPFLRPDWEEEQIRAALEDSKDKKGKKKED